MIPDTLSLGIQLWLPADCSVVVGMSKMVAAEDANLLQCNKKDKFQASNFQLQLLPRKGPSLRRFSVFVCKKARAPWDHERCNKV